MLLQVILLIVGFGLVIKGADWMVTGASFLAKRYNIPDLAIGLTVVAFGTSAPELVINVFASFENHPEIVFGNIVGSNFFNLFLILGLVGVITPLSVQSTTVWREIPFSFFAVLLLYGLSNSFLANSEGVLSRTDGFILLVFFVSFLLYIYIQLKADRMNQKQNPKSRSVFKIWALILVGLAGLIIGGQLVVNNAILLAPVLGMSESVVGLTIVAAGTSLPELVTSVVAAIKKNSDIAIGNIIGSNIFNIFFIMGVSSVIKPLAYDKTFNVELVIIALGTMILFIMMFTGIRKKLDRWEAVILLAIYIAYTFYLINPGIISK